MLRKEDFKEIIQEVEECASIIQDVPHLHFITSLKEMQKLKRFIFLQEATDKKQRGWLQIINNEDSTKEFTYYNENLILTISSLSSTGMLSTGVFDYYHDFNPINKTVHPDPIKHMLDLDINQFSNIIAVFPIEEYDSDFINKVKKIKHFPPFKP